MNWWGWVLGAGLVCWTGSVAQAQGVETGEAGRLRVSGFLSGSVFVQDRLFAPGNGHNAQWVDPEPFGRWWHGGDVRSTRVTLGFEGPEVLGRWQVGGTLETDFFGGILGEGGFAAEQPLPRLRLAFVELRRGGTAVRLGQDWAPLFGYVPESVTHLAFPLGAGAAGLPGWRYPGVFLFQDLARSERGRLELRVAAMSGGWDDAPVPELPTAGQLAGLPQLEARLDWESRAAEGIGWGAYLVGHLDRKELGGVTDPGGGERLHGWAVQAGARIEPAPLVVQGNAYIGRAVGHQQALIGQFGDIRGWGGWAQAGVRLADRWSLWSFFGIDDPRDRDIEIGGRPDNRVFNQMLRLREGPFDLGLEWMHARTTHRLAEAAPPTATFLDRRSGGNQIALSALYRF